jgi:hypothetical protein
MENKHNQAIPRDVIEQIQDLLNQVKELMSPYAVALTPSERHSMPKMGEKSVAFVDKAHDIVEQNRQMCPPYLDIDAFNVDYEDANGLWALQNIATQVQEIISDTAMAAGSEAYQASLAFYNYIKIAAAQNVPGAKAIYEELRTRFPRGKRKPAEVETETITETIKNEVKVS